MIISYRHKFIFLHNPKVAGSSLNLALAPHLGRFDIMLGSEAERVDAGFGPNIRAYADAVRRKPLSIFAAIGGGSDSRMQLLKLQAGSYRRQLGPIVDHPLAEQVRALDKKAWQRHFKFSFVRNSYERMVSLYLYVTRKHGDARDPFAVFVPKLVEGASPFERWQHLADPWPVYAIGDRIAADFVGRYEHLETDFMSLCEQLDLPGLRLPHMKRAKPYDYRDFYDANTRALVHQLCEREIDHFGYRFDR